MTSITYIGMDVHTTSYTLCSYSYGDDRAYAFMKTPARYEEILKYIDRIKKNQSKDNRIVCGYEAGCLGYALYHQLTDHGVDCIILAPSTMASSPNNKVKTDKRDAEKIARCLSNHDYKPVYVPDAEDDSVKEYIRMRDDVKQHLKSTKQQIIAFYTRHGFQYDGKTPWTEKHLKVVKEKIRNTISEDICEETGTPCRSSYLRSSYDGTFCDPRAQTVELQADH